MDEEKLVTQLPGTNIIISGIEKIKLHLPEAVEFVKNKQVKTVFLILYKDLLESWHPLHLEETEMQLKKEGINFIPLVKRPNDISTFEMVSKNIEKMSAGENALLMCYHGKHNSAAYATYHLLKHGYGLKRSAELLRKSGWGVHDIIEVHKILNNAFLFGKFKNVKNFSEHYFARALRRKLPTAKEDNPQLIRLAKLRILRAKRFAKKRKK